MNKINPETLMIRPNGEILLKGRLIAKDKDAYIAIQHFAYESVSANKKCLSLVEKYKEQCLIASWPVIVCALILGFSIGIIFCIFSRKSPEKLKT